MATSKKGKSKEKADTVQTSTASREEDIKTLAEKVKGIRVAMLTTLDPDGVLRSRPMATQEIEGDGKLWFFTKEHSGKVDSIRKDQHVNLAYADEKDHRWVSVAGRAQIVRDRNKMAELWSPMLKSWFPQELEDPDIALICVDIESAQYWDSPSGAFVALMGLAKATVTGKPLDQNKFSERIDLRH